MKKKIVLSAISATGKLTLGNYIGAILPLVKMQDEYEVIVMCADLHGKINRPSPEELEASVKHIIRYLKLAGIKNVVLQSEIKGLTDNFYDILTNSNVGELLNMPQYKVRKEKNKEIPMGLITYPVLMAADIDTLNADYVFIGKDQEPHLDLIKKILKRTKRKVPKVMMNELGANKIRGLRNPTQKMSKSSKSINDTIFLDDDKDTVEAKIMSAVTDDKNEIHIDYENKPGISNLITIYYELNERSVKDVGIEFPYWSITYDYFKETTADEINRAFDKWRKLII